MFDQPFNLICNEVSNSTLQQSSYSHIEKIKYKFPNIFQNVLGCCMKVKAELDLKSNAKPAFQPKLRVPYTAHSFAEKNKLDGLEALSVLEPVNCSL